MTEIMIVDDDPSIRRMLERTLAAEGYDVRLAADGGAALAELERSLPDLARPGRGDAGPRRARGR
jgi:two-component system, OmpR family, response regulator MprA